MDEWLDTCVEVELMLVAQIRMQSSIKMNRFLAFERVRGEEERGTRKVQCPSVQGMRWEIRVLKIVTHSSSL